MSQIKINSSYQVQKNKKKQCVSNFCVNLEPALISCCLVYNVTSRFITGCDSDLGAKG